MPPVTDVADLPGHGQRLAGEHRFVNGGSPLDDLAVDRHLLPGPDPHPVVDAQQRNRDFDLTGSPEHPGGAGPQANEGPNRLAGGPLGSGFQGMPQLEKGEDHHRGVEVEVVGSTGNEIRIGDHQHRGHPGGAGPQCHQGIHVGGPVPGLLPGADEIAASAEDHGEQAKQSSPGPEQLPVVGMGKEAGHVPGHEHETHQPGKESPLPGSADLQPRLLGLPETRINERFLEHYLVANISEPQQHIGRMLGGFDAQPPFLEFHLEGCVRCQEDLANLLQIGRLWLRLQPNEKGIAGEPLPQGSAVALTKDRLHRQIRLHRPAPKPFSRSD